MKTGSPEEGPGHHVIRRQGLGVDVEEEAVLAATDLHWVLGVYVEEVHLQQSGELAGLATAAYLRAHGGRPTATVLHPEPGLVRSGVLEPAETHRGLRVRDALETGETAVRLQGLRDSHLK